jgi:hypothetical protein
MKLAEALLLRADLLKKSASLRERIVANAVVQEGEEPHESPGALLKEAFDVVEQLEGLMMRIHRANLETTLADGRTLTQVLARRDAVAQQHGLLIAAIAGCRKEPERYSVREIKWVATLKVPKLQKQADDLAKQLRELNARIQEANWQAELAD